MHFPLSPPCFSCLAFWFPKTANRVCGNIAFLVLEKDTITEHLKQLSSRRPEVMHPKLMRELAIVIATAFERL